MNDTKPSYWREPLLAFSRISVWIVGPILIALFLGKWLDEKFGTAPLLFALTMGAAFLISSYGIVREAKKYIAGIEAKNPKQPTHNEPDNDHNSDH